MTGPLQMCHELNRNATFNFGQLYPVVACKGILHLCFRDEDKQKGKCFGGIARLQTAVKKLRASDKNVLWLNAGDFYQGTVWYSHFKWKVTTLSTVSTLSTLSTQYLL